MHPSILIVDDSEVDRYLLRRLITKTRIAEAIYEVADGREAIDFLDKYEAPSTRGSRPPIMVLLDINMPIMDGYEFLETYSSQLRPKTHREATVLAMFTTSQQEQDKEAALRYDCVKGYLVKNPESVEEVTQTIRALVPS